jgi:hypothetical protein
VIGLQTVNAVNEGSAPPVQSSKPDHTAAGGEAEIDPPAFYSATETTVAATRLVLRLPTATAHPPFGTQADGASQEHRRPVRIVGGQQLRLPREYQRLEELAPGVARRRHEPETSLRQSGGVDRLEER